ncbi:E3 ubiquitin-protein ligase RNF169 isoform X1 [Gadus morhua]|uniref:E3 ubiquitin-protein ligase RNF169 isoform X1 n=1 Tax=Gadus morhua TaxID=8049 RepID=UPI0011B5C2AE|nr:E3 ubiquitin-protein ligase RNF169-like isoform X1 [Gadus morhua]
MAAAASAERPAEAKEMCPGSGPLLRLRSASDPQARAPTGELKCPAGCGGDLPGPGPAALPRCGLSACLRCFQRPRSGPRCRLRGSCRRPGSETGPAVEPEPWEPSRRSRPERCRSRLDRRKDSSEAGSQGSRCGGMTSDQQSKVKVKAVLSDSENEEPVGKRTRNVSGALRKSKTPSAFRDASQRSQSCTASVEGGGKRRFLPQSSVMNAAGARHSCVAGILLSSENSPAVSSPVSGDRRLAWRGPATSFPPPARPERSVSPESNDSISEELNHFKPIVCSPCTPPRRLADGRLLEPAVVKSTPRNLLRGLQSPTSYQASPAVLLKWRQIELDRQSLRVTSKATLTCSPPGAPEEGPPAQGAFPLRARRRVFGPAAEPGDLKRTAVKDPPGPWRSRTPGPPLPKETETQDHPDPRRGKHTQKTRHTEPPPPDGKRARVLLQPAPPGAPGGPFPRVPPDLPGRTLALRRRTPLACEQQPGGKARAPRYLLRPRVAKQSQRRQSPRRPKRLSRKY